jgi:hypothetical protein
MRGKIYAKGRLLAPINSGFIVRLFDVAAPCQTGFDLKPQQIRRICEKNHAHQFDR